MSLSSRAIALQGVGFSPLLVAVQGFGDFQVAQAEEERRARSHRPHILPLAEGCTVPLLARTSTGVWLKKPQGYTTPSVYVPPIPVVPLPAVVHIPPEFLRSPAPARVSSGVAPRLEVRAVGCAAVAPPTAGATARMRGVSCRSGGVATGAAAGAVVGKLVLTNKTRAASLTARAVENPTDEEVVAILLAARRRKLLTPRRSLW